MVVGGHTQAGVIFNGLNVVKHTVSRLKDDESSGGS